MIERPRRLRQSPALRSLLRETNLRVDQLVQPYFLAESPRAQEPITGFTEVYRWGVDSLSGQIEKNLKHGIKGFLFFGSTTKKDEVGSGAYDEKGLLPEAIRVIKQRFGSQAVLFTDVCLCPYTNHGHCGVIEGNKVVNDASLPLLADMALAHARAGADFVAPSDMMDGRVGAIRQRLDEQGFQDTGILAYTAKYASAYYGPFREALASAPQGTDRATYQMDFANTGEALRELRLDISEGADMVMVKPALPYLDIISKLSEASDIPVAAYSVSGEYEMVKALVAKGMADEKKMILENLFAIRRAGAQLILTYHASQVSEQRWLE